MSKSGIRNGMAAVAAAAALVLPAAPAQAASADAAPCIPGSLYDVWPCACETASHVLERATGKGLYCGI